MAKSEKTPNLKFGLGTKLIVSLVGSLIIIFGVMTMFTYNSHERHLHKVLVQGAARIADTIESSLRYNMLSSNCKEAFKLIQTIGASESISKIRIFDNTGVIRYSTDVDEVNAHLEKSADQCVVCHSGQNPAKELISEQRWRIYNDNKSRVLGLINPIWNEKQCSSIECHYHASDTHVLGVLDVSMSLQQVDEELAGERNVILLGYIITMIVVALITGLSILFMVLRPVKLLIEGTEFAAKGHLDHKLRIDSDDELGQLSISFNKMTKDLKKARHEVTEWAKTLEQKVKEKTDELERAHEQMIQIEKMASLGKLSAIVAHEINNPLTGILTYSKLLQKKIEKKMAEILAGGEADFTECANYLDIIEKETARCGDIVKNLLTFSKKDTVHLEQANLNDLLRRSIKLVNHQFELANIKIEQYLDPNLPSIICDTGQVQQIFVALLINAIEAIGKDGTVKAKTFFDFVNRLVVFQITDNGSGMDDETIERIFEPFFSTKGQSHGSGLGLTVVYGIVERHGAKISVDSAPGKGTTFTIRFALEPANKEAKLRIPASTPPDRI